MFFRACVRGGKMMSCQKITLDDSIIRKLEGKYINFPRSNVTRHCQTPNLHVPTHTVYWRSMAGHGAIGSVRMDYCA